MEKFAPLIVALFAMFPMLLQWLQQLLALGTG